MSRNLLSFYCMRRYKAERLLPLPVAGASAGAAAGAAGGASRGFLISWNAVSGAAGTSDVGDSLAGSGVDAGSSALGIFGGASGEVGLGSGAGVPPPPLIGMYMRLKPRCPDTLLTADAPPMAWKFYW
jgi:hypothetical protein